MTPKMVYQHWEVIRYSYHFEAFWFNIYMEDFIINALSFVSAAQSQVLTL
jgi:hypothetical protein